MCHNSKYYLRILMQKLRKNTVNLSQDNTGSLKQGAGVLITLPQCSVQEDHGHVKTSRKLKTRTEYVPQDKCIKHCTCTAELDSTQVFTLMSPWAMMCPPSKSGPCPSWPFERQPAGASNHHKNSDTWKNSV
jgi:hypothetical protein